MPCIIIQCVIVKICHVCIRTMRELLNAGGGGAMTSGLHLRGLLYTGETGMSNHNRLLSYTFQIEEMHYQPCLLH